MDNVAKWLSTGEVKIRSQNTHFVKLYLFGEQGGVCALCGLGASWNGQPLVFVLDHIDGDAQNNHRDNLRLICPNCDSQLPTYKARNKGRGRAWRRDRYANGQSY